MGRPQAEIGSDTISYTYNINGIRTSKTVGTETTEYFLEGSTIIAQKTGNNVLWFLYDADGQRIGFTYNDTPYLYVYNATGDVVGIVDDTLTMVVKYTYSPWGEILSTTGDEADTIGVINPFRYRGYYYDEETGLYCLNSRYYDPETSRFINADTTDILTATTDRPNHDKNLYAYCDNNPITRKDVGGDFWVQVGATLIGGTVGVLAEVFTQMASGKEFTEIDWTSVAIEGLSGAATGLLMSVGLPASTVTLGRAAINATTSVAHSIHNGDGVTETIKGAAFSAGTTMAFGTGMEVGRKFVGENYIKWGKIGTFVKKRLEPKKYPFVPVLTNRALRGGTRLSKEFLESRMFPV